MLNVRKKKKKKKNPEEDKATLFSLHNLKSVYLLVNGKILTRNKWKERSSACWADPTLSLD